MSNESHSPRGIPDDRPSAGQPEKPTSFKLQGVKTMGHRCLYSGRYEPTETLKPSSITSFGLTLAASTPTDFSDSVGTWIGSAMALRILKPRWK